MTPEKNTSQINNWLNIAESKVANLIGRVGQPDKTWITPSKVVDLTTRLRQVIVMCENAITMLDNTVQRLQTVPAAPVAPLSSLEPHTADMPHVDATPSNGASAAA